ncbi:metallophosphoesterase family protein [Paenibacillus sp. CAU 1782]
MGTKVAIITDVHGNRSALRAVLEEIDNDSEIQHIYCLGDMIAIGHESNEVLELLFARNDVSMVTGNHDEAVMALIQGKEYPVSHSHCKEHHEWIASRIDRKFVPKLMELPRIMTPAHDVKQLLLHHYHMTEQKKFAPISDDPFASIEKDPTPDKLDLQYDGCDADIVCFGHHHTKHFFISNKRIYLNPGSLGCYDLPAARYAVLNIGGRIDVSFKEVPYDNKEFLASYHRLGVPDSDFILKIFHGNQHIDV